MRFRFTIDTLGRIYLLQPIYASYYENQFYFNLTIMATNSYGYSAFAGFVTFLNTTANTILQQSIFSFSIESPKSELNLVDYKSLSPPLNVVVNVLM